MCILIRATATAKRVLYANNETQKQQQCRNSINMQHWREAISRTNQFSLQFSLFSTLMLVGKCSIASPSSASGVVSASVICNLISVSHRLCMRFLCRSRWRRNICMRRCSIVRLFSISSFSRLYCCVRRINWFNMATSSSAVVPSIIDFRRLSADESNFIIIFKCYFCIGYFQSISKHVSRHCSRSSVHLIFYLYFNNYSKYLALVCYVFCYEWCDNRSIEMMLLLLLVSPLLLLHMRWQFAIFDTGRMNMCSECRNKHYCRFFFYGLCLCPNRDVQKWLYVHGLIIR